MQNPEFGNKLRSSRESLNLSIEQVSEKTKIRPHILKELEEGNLGILPVPYLISFIKTYSSYLRLPDDETELLLEQIRNSAGIEKPKKHVPPVSNEKINIKDTVHRLKIGKFNLNIKNSNIINYLIYTSLGLTLLVIIYVTFFMGSGEKKQFSGELEVQADTSNVENINDDLESFFAPMDSIILEAYGRDTAWMKIVIDGSKAEQLTMYPEMERRWSAKDYFMLSVGNEGAVIFRRDGEELPPFGNRGTIIRNIKITRDKIDIASSPWSDSTALKKKKRKKKETKPEIRFLEPSNVNTEPPKINQ